MVTTVNSDNKGFTLLEFLVAVVIMTVGLLALLQTVNLSIIHNMTNQLRNEAIYVADERMSNEKMKPFGAISSAGAPGRINSYSYMRPNSGVFVNYSVVKTTTDQTAYTKNIDIAVSWRYRGVRYTHSLSTLVSQNQ